MIWLFLDSDLIVTSCNFDDKVQMFAMALRVRLRQFYKDQKAIGIHLTELNDVTPKMLGSRDEKKVKTKGAEAFGLV